MPTRPGYAPITPYLVCRDAHAAIDYYVKHFGAAERYRLPLPDGAVAYAEIEINGMVLIIADEVAQWDVLSPKSLNGSPVSLNIYVENCDHTFMQMIEDGADELLPITDQIHGDRTGKLRDPFGHLWYISTNIEELSPDEIVHRFSRLVE